MQDGEKPVWILHVDGSSTSGGSGVGLVLQGPHNAKISYVLKFSFDVSNNEAEYEAEYEALVAGLKFVKDIGAEKIEILSDSMLIVQQLKGEYEAKDDGMIKYLQVVRSLVSEFQYWNITKVPRSENSETDRLAKYATVAIPNPEKFEDRIFVEFLPTKSTDRKLPKSCQLKQFFRVMLQKAPVPKQIGLTG